MILLIEFRKFPHLEFLLRNTMIKFPDWNHTIVCGNINEDFIRHICFKICNGTNALINIIKLNIDIYEDYFRRTSSGGKGRAQQRHFFDLHFAKKNRSLCWLKQLLTGPLLHHHYYHQWLTGFFLLTLSYHSNLWWRRS